MKKNMHRWPRATTSDVEWGPLCDCGALKTDQALTCVNCAIERRRAVDYWDLRTCDLCGGPKSKRASMCRPCKNKLQIGLAVVTGRLQPQDHPWRKWAA